MNSSGRLANQSTFNIVGQLTRCSLKLKGFRVSFQLYVADLPGLDVVLGLDFLKHYDPDIRWSQRLLKLRDPRRYVDNNMYIIPAISREALPKIHTNHVELCTMRQFADLCASNEVCEGGFRWCYALF